MHYPLLLALLGGCFSHLNVDAFNAVQAYQTEGVVPYCSFFYEGMKLPDGSVVDQINGKVVVVLRPDPQSSGERDHTIPCRK